VVGFLGTKYTMENAFLQDRLRKHKLEVISPTDEGERKAIQEIIEQELSRNVINEASKKVFLESIKKLVQRGAQGIILGCTEISLLIQQDDVSEAPVFDTTMSHALAAVDVQLGVAEVEHYEPVL